MSDLDLRSLLAVVVIIGAVQVTGWIVARVGQPRVIGEIVAGILLGPSLLGLVAPSLEAQLFPHPVMETLQVLAQLGLVIFMFLIGLEFDSHMLHRQGRRVMAIAQASIVVPALLAVPIALALHDAYGAGVDRTTFCVFIAAAMGITAFPVLARLLRETGLLHTRPGSVSLLCAALNDLVAWVLLAVVVALLNADGPGSVLRLVVLLTGFVAVTLSLVRPLLRRMPEVPLWFALFVALGCALTTDAAGGHLILGAFLAGLLMPDRPDWRRSVHARLDGVVSALLLPVFFAMVGLSTRVDQLTTTTAWTFVVLVILVATAGKLGGSAITARLVGEDRRDATTIGILMNTRGITEIVFLSAGLQLGVISSTVFTIMVLMALVTTFMAVPALRLMTGWSPSVSAPGGPRDRRTPASPLQSAEIER